MLVFSHSHYPRTPLAPLTLPCAFTCPSLPLLPLSLPASPPSPHTHTHLHMRCQLLNQLLLRATALQLTRLPCITSRPLLLLHLLHLLHLLPLLPLLHLLRWRRRLLLLLGVCADSVGSKLGAGAGCACR